MAEPTQRAIGHIEFISDQEQQFFAEAMLGESVRDFLVSDTGRYLHGRAKHDFNQCVKESFKIDPYTSEGKRQYENLKQKAQAAENFMKWCAEAIINGDTASTQLENYRQDGE